MKRTRFFSILAVLLVLMMAVPAVASASTVKLAYSGGSINLRSGPGTGYASAGYVHNGDSISVVDYGDVWSKVKTSSGKVGYIKNLYINDGDDSYAAGTSYYDSSYTAYITASVNFRAGAGTDTRSMGTLKKGAKVKVHGKNGSWYLVENSAGTQGYVSSKYISKSSSSSSSGSGSGSSTHVKVTSASVNMRKGGGMHYAVIRVVPKGANVEIITKGNYWSKVSYKDNIGWIKNSYLK